MICKIAKQQSIFTWSTLVTADALGCRVGEESFTDFLVLKLAKSASISNYFVRAFNKHEESFNGADWELWLTGASGKWLGYRIQAKVIDVAKLRYPHLHPNPKGGTPQVKKLITAAATAGAIPIYCLYSAWSTNAPTPAWPCGTYPQDLRLWGISVISASAVSAIAPKNDLATLCPQMAPFHCLVCCNGHGGSDLPTKSHAFATEKLRVNDDLRDAPPEHVARLIYLARSQYPEEIDLGEGLSRVVILSDQELG